MNIAPIIASAGILGIALGFGAQSLVKDFLSGVFMIFEDQFGVGDVIDVGAASGTVEAVSLRVTRLRDLDGTVWYVPNGEILRVGNKSQNWSRAVVDIGVGYDEDLARAKQVLAEVAHDLWEDEDFRSVIIEEPEVTGVEALNPDAITLRVLREDRADGAVGRRPRAAAADQGAVRPRGDRDPVPAAGGLAPGRPATLGVRRGGRFGGRGGERRRPGLRAQPTSAGSTRTTSVPTKSTSHSCPSSSAATNGLCTAAGTDCAWVASPSTGNQ